MGIETGLFGIKRKQVKRYKRIKRSVIPNFKLSDLDMREISSDMAIQYISTNHYSKTCTRSIAISFGFYFDNELVGCAVYANPVGMNVVNSIADDLEFDSVLELTRLFMSDKLPNNVESYCIGKTIRYIKHNLEYVKYLIAYADTSFGHCGIIYQATNWLYTGQTEKKASFEYKGQVYHQKTMYDMYGSSSIPFLENRLGPELKVRWSNAKNRYIYPLGQSKSEHKELLEALKYEISDYPKQDIKYYRLE